MVSFHKAIVTGVVAFVLSAFLQGCGGGPKVHYTKNEKVLNADAILQDKGFLAAKAAMQNFDAARNAAKKTLDDAKKQMADVKRLVEVKLASETKADKKKGEAHIKEAEKTMDKLQKKYDETTWDMQENCYDATIEDAPKCFKQHEVWMKAVEKTAEMFQTVMKGVEKTAEKNGIFLYEGKFLLPEEDGFADTRFKIAPIISFVGGVALSMITVGLLASGYRRISRMNNDGRSITRQDLPLSHTETDVLLAEGGIVESEPQCALGALPLVPPLHHVEGVQVVPPQKM